MGARWCLERMGSQANGCRVCALACCGMLSCWSNVLTSARVMGNWRGSLRPQGWAAACSGTSRRSAGGGVYAAMASEGVTAGRACSCEPVPCSAFARPGRLNWSWSSSLADIVLGLHLQGGCVHVGGSMRAQTAACAGEGGSASTGR
eukprot:85926-Chlamydomonas_euryale.AAC.2